MAWETKGGKQWCLYYIRGLKEYTSHEEQSIFYFCSDIKSHQMCSFQLKLYKAVSLSVHMYHHGSH
jgi:hypothetical protein